MGKVIDQLASSDYLGMGMTRRNTKGKRSVQSGAYRTDLATSKRMSAVRPKDTTPEKLVRAILTRMKLRYRLHYHGLPGRPDIVFPGRKKVIFVHGCYWHRHEGCPRATTPTRNAKLWKQKFRETVERDRKNADILRQEGWRYLVVWECETHQTAELEARFEAFLTESTEE